MPRRPLDGAPDDPGRSRILGTARQNRLPPPGGRTAPGARACRPSRHRSSPCFASYWSLQKYPHPPRPRSRARQCPGPLRRLLAPPGAEVPGFLLTPLPALSQRSIAPPPAPERRFVDSEHARRLQRRAPGRRCPAGARSLDLHRREAVAEHRLAQRGFRDKAATSGRRRAGTPRAPRKRQTGLAPGHASGFTQRTPGNRAKSASVLQRVSPCSTARAARCASGTRSPAGCACS